MSIVSLSVKYTVEIWCLARCDQLISGFTVSCAIVPFSIAFSMTRKQRAQPGFFASGATRSWALSSRMAGKRGGIESPGKAASLVLEKLRILGGKEPCHQRMLCFFIFFSSFIRRLFSSM